MKSTNTTGADSRARLERLLDRDVASFRAWEEKAFAEDAGPLAQSLVLYGAGTLGRRLLACLRSANIEPVAFSDSSRKLWNTSVDGLAVVSPEEAARRFGRSAALVVTIHNGFHRFAETR